MTTAATLDAPLNVAAAVRDRYGAAAGAVENELCCPVDYDAEYLKIIPDEILDRDYGCGDPSKWVAAGETVLDLGSGGGKICYIAAQVVGESGRVIGVDVNEDMLALARQHRPAIAADLGYDNVSFRRGRIQDLGLDLDRLDALLASQPVIDTAAWLQAQEETERLRTESPMIPSGSVDVVVSNCVLNLVAESDRRQLFEELARVLKPGGRAVISDIVSDVDVPEAMKQDADLWSGCLSGAYQESAFLEAFEAVGLTGIEVVARQAEPWRVIEGIEFRSVTVRAYRPPACDGDPSDQAGEVVIYNGPWAAVMSEAGTEFVRGQPTPVNRGQFAACGAAPFAGQFTRLQSNGESGIPIESGGPVDPPQNGLGGLSVLDDGCCGSDGCC